MTLPQLPHFDFREEGSSITVEALLLKLGEYAPDWEVEVWLCGDKVVHLSLSDEDIEADGGKVILSVGSAGQEIHVWSMPGIEEE